MDTRPEGGSSAQAFKKRLFPYLQLIRLPNLFTAMADPLAGYLIAFGPSGGLFQHALGLMGVSALVYAGGCALNDFCDRGIDARERPTRPIPSGRVRPGGALGLACALFGTALGISGLVSAPSMLVTCVLVFLVVAYDAGSKPHALLGPVNMAACRSVNLLLGMSPTFPPSLLGGSLPVLSFAYVLSLTLLSRHEAVDGPVAMNRVPFWAWGATMAGVAALVLGQALSWEALLFFVPLVALTGRVLGRASMERSTEGIGRAVGTMVLCIPLLDAAYAAGVQGWVVGIAVGAWAMPAMLLSRRFYVT
jgi:4-hydroxybenzoate polyprenyltransferase